MHLLAVQGPSGATRDIASSTHTTGSCSPGLRLPTLGMVLILALFLIARELRLGLRWSEDRPLFSRNLVGVVGGSSSFQRAIGSPLAEMRPGCCLRDGIGDSAAVRPA